MKEQDLIRTCETFFNQWFGKIKNLQLQNKVRASGEIHCGNEVNIFESKDHFIIELSGSEPIISFKSIQVKNKILNVGDTTNHLIGGFKIKDLNKKKPLYSFYGCRRVYLINDDFISGVESKNSQSKYNQKDGKLNEIEIPIFIDSESDYILIENSRFGYYLPDFKFYFRIHSFTLVIKKKTKKEALLSFLISTAENQLKSQQEIFMGLFINSKPIVRFCQELLSLANQTVHETRIDAFINKYNKPFATALNYKSARSNIELKIIDKSGWEKETLIPDYLMEREDGSFDILDLKKGLIDKSLTIGGKSRRRLNSYCYELVAQLEGYKRYFASPQNSKWAWENLGIKLNDSPRLIGIVGNQNSFFQEEIDEALLVHRENVTLYSYNSLCDLLISQNPSI